MSLRNRFLLMVAKRNTIDPKTPSVVTIHNENSNKVLFNESTLGRKGMPAESESTRI